MRFALILLFYNNVKGLTMQRIIFRVEDCCLIWTQTTNIDSIILDLKKKTQKTKRKTVSLWQDTAHTQMAEQLALTFPSDTFFCVRLSSLSATDSSFMDWATKYHITYPPDIHYSPCSAFSWGMVFILCPRWWPHPLAPSSSLGGPPRRTKDSCRSECFSAPPTL